MKRWIVLLTIVVLLIAGLAGSYLYFKQTPDVVQKEPDVAVSVSELISAFQEDAAVAREKYIDKIVEVTGTVKSISTDGTVVLGESGTASDVVAGLDRRYRADIEKVTVGKMAVVQGVCSGYTTGGTADPADMLAALGTTVQLRSAGIKSVK